MPAPVNFPILTSETVLFQNRAAAQQFFNSANVPDASINTPGVMRKADIVEYAHFNDYPDAEYINLNFNGVEHTLVKAATLEDLRTKVATLSTAVSVLLQKLKEAGHVQG